MFKNCCGFWKKKETPLEKALTAKWNEIGELEEKIRHIEIKIIKARANIILDDKQEERVLEISDVLDKLSQQGVSITLAKLKEHVSTVPNCGAPCQMQLLLLFEDCCLRNEYFYERTQIYNAPAEIEKREEKPAHGQSLSMQGNREPYS